MASVDGRVREVAIRTRWRPAIIATLVAAASWLGSSSAQAGLTCTVVSVTSMNFGTYDVFSASSLTSTATITFNCKKVGGASTLTIDISTGGSGTSFSR